MNLCHHYLIVVLKIHIKNIILAAIDELILAIFKFSLGIRF